MTERDERGTSGRAATSNPGAVGATEVHALLLGLAGRLDDDLLAWARELVAVGEEGQAVELVVAALVAERVALPAALRAAVVRAGHTDLDADAELAPAAPDDVAGHRFDAAAGSGERVAAVLAALPARRLAGCTLHLTWRLTPAGAAPGPLPRAVVLVETGPDRSADVLAYLLATELDRAGVAASVEVFAVGDDLPAYHVAALRTARRIDVGASVIAPAGVVVARTVTEAAARAEPPAPADVPTDTAALLVMPSGDESAARAVEARRAGRRRRPEQAAEPSSQVTRDGEVGDRAVDDAPDTDPFHGPLRVPLLAPLLDPTGSDPTGSGPTGSDATGSDRAGLHPTGSDPTRSHPTGSHPTESDPTRSHPTGSDPTGSNTDDRPPAVPTPIRPVPAVIDDPDEPAAGPEESAGAPWSGAQPGVAAAEPEIPDDVPQEWENDWRSGEWAIPPTPAAAPPAPCDSFDISFDVFETPAPPADENAVERTGRTELPSRRDRQLPVRGRPDPEPAPPPSAAADLPSRAAEGRRREKPEGKRPPGGPFGAEGTVAIPSSTGRDDGGSGARRAEVSLFDSPTSRVGPPPRPSSPPARSEDVPLFEEPPRDGGRPDGPPPDPAGRRRRPDAGDPETAADAEPSVLSSTERDLLAQLQAELTDRERRPRPYRRARSAIAPAVNGHGVNGHATNDRGVNDRGPDDRGPDDSGTPDPDGPGPG